MDKESVIHTYSGIKEGNPAFGNNMEDLEDIMLGEISQRKSNTVYSHLYAESKKGEFIEIEFRMVIFKG